MLSLFYGPATPSLASGEEGLHIRTVCSRTSFQPWKISNGVSCLLNVADGVDQLITTVGLRDQKL